MKKVLKIKLEMKEGGNYGVTILEQSHRCTEFGNGTSTNDGFVAKNGVKLKSLGSIDWNGSNTLFVRGGITKRDDREAVVSANFAMKLIVAVAEYNAHNFEDSETEKIEATLSEFGCQKENIRSLLKALKLIK